MGSLRIGGQTRGMQVHAGGDRGCGMWGRRRATAVRVAFMMTKAAGTPDPATPSVLRCREPRGRQAPQLPAFRERRTVGTPEPTIPCVHRLLSPQLLLSAAAPLLSRPTYSTYYFMIFMFWDNSMPAAKATARCYVYHRMTHDDAMRKSQDSREGFS